MEGVKKVGVEFLGIEKETSSASSCITLFPKLKTLYFGDYGGVGRVERSGRVEGRGFSYYHNAMPFFFNQISILPSAKNTARLLAENTTSDT